MQCQQALVSLNTDLRYERSSSGMAAPWTEAPYGIYETLDSYITMSMVASQKLALVFNIPDRLLGLTEAAAFEARDELTATIKPQLRARNTEEWLAAMGKHDIWAAPVLSLSEVLAHEQVAANHFVEAIPLPDGGTVQAVGMAFAVDGVPSAARLAPPRVGQHTDEIWAALRGHTAGDATGTEQK